MPPWTTGEDAPPDTGDARIAELIHALSALQEPARTLHTLVRTIVEPGHPKIGERLRTHLLTIGEACGLLGPSTTRALSELVSILENGGDASR